MGWGEGESSTDRPFNIWATDFNSAPYLSHSPTNNNPHPLDSNYAGEKQQPRPELSETVTGLLFLISQILTLLLFYDKNLCFLRYFEIDAILNTPPLQIFVGLQKDSPNLVLWLAASPMNQSHSTKLYKR